MARTYSRASRIFNIAALSLFTYVGLSFGSEAMAEYKANKALTEGDNKEKRELMKSAHAWEDFNQAISPYDAKLKLSKDSTHYTMEMTRKHH